MTYKKEIERMTLAEMIKLTGCLPDKGVTENGFGFVVDVTKNKLGYIACLWQVVGLGVKERVIQYGTGHSPEKARETLRNKILRDSK